MRKTIMDKVFDVISGENERFARIQEEASRPRPAEKTDVLPYEGIEGTRATRQKDDSKMTLCA